MSPLLSCHLSFSFFYIEVCCLSLICLIIWFLVDLLPACLSLNEMEQLPPEIGNAKKQRSYRFKNATIIFARLSWPHVPPYCRCRPCGKTSTKCCDLKRHILSKHAKPTNEICPTCKRTYKNKPSLQAHISSKKCTVLKPHSRDDFWVLAANQGCNCRVEK